MNWSSLLEKFGAKDKAYLLPLIPLVWCQTDVPLQNLQGLLGNACSSRLMVDPVQGVKFEPIAVALYPADKAHDHRRIVATLQEVQGSVQRAGAAQKSGGPIAVWSPGLKLIALGDEDLVRFEGLEGTENDIFACISIQQGYAFTGAPLVQSPFEAFCFEANHHSDWISLQG